jgi:hypothetical protein
MLIKGNNLGLARANPENKALIPPRKAVGLFFFRSVSHTSLTCSTRITHAEGVNPLRFNLDRLRDVFFTSCHAKLSFCLLSQYFNEIARPETSEEKRNI